MVVCFSNLKRLKHKTLPFVANEKELLLLRLFILNKPILQLKFCTISNISQVLSLSNSLIKMNKTSVVHILVLDSFCLHIQECELLHFKPFILAPFGLAKIKDASCNLADIYEVY